MHYKTEDERGSERKTERGSKSGREKPRTRKNSKQLKLREGVGGSTKLYQVAERACEKVCQTHKKLEEERARVRETETGR